MRPKLLTPYFLVTLVALWAAAGLIWLGSFRVPTAALTLRIVAEAGALEEIRDTLIDTAPTLGFYNAVLATDRAVRDPWANASPDERKRGWHTLVTLERGQEGELLLLTARGRDAVTSERLARATALALLQYLGRNYPGKAVDLRIASGPHQGATIENWPGFVGITLASGTGVTLVFFLIIGLIDAGLQRRLASRKIPQAMRPIGPETFRPQVPTWWDDTRREQSKTAFSRPVIESELEALVDRTQGISRSPVAPVTAPAPPNLPVLETESITPLQGAMARLFKEDIDAATRASAFDPQPAHEPVPLIQSELIQSEENEPSPAQVAAPAPQTGEPTPEEYKRRLNELLSGRM